MFGNSSFSSINNFKNTNIFGNTDFGNTNIFGANLNSNNENNENNGNNENNENDENEEKSNYFKEEMKSEEDTYILTIEKKESSKIFIECKLKDKAIALYDYSIELSLEEFHKKSYIFHQCKNIDEIYFLLTNIIKGISLSYKSLKSKDVESSSGLELNDNILYLILRIPLLTKKIEEVKIQFIGEKKDVNNQFEILKNKYKSMVKLIYNNNNKTYHNNSLFSPNLNNSNEILRDLKNLIEEKENENKLFN